jgi:hypothetical protein
VPFKAVEEEEERHSSQKPRGGRRRRTGTRKCERKEFEEAPTIIQISI